MTTNTGFSNASFYTDDLTEALLPALVEYTGERSESAVIRYAVKRLAQEIAANPDGGEIATILAKYQEKAQ